MGTVEGTVEGTAVADQSMASSLVSGIRGRRWIGWKTPLSGPIGGSAGDGGMDRGLV